MKLRPANQRIEMSGEDAIRVLREIELILVSLHKIGSYYAVSDEGEASYARETTRFIDEWRVVDRLAEARGLLSRPFDSTLADDGMDDLERELQVVEAWSSPRSSPGSSRTDG